jgi:hypothetical protein
MSRNSSRSRRRLVIGVVVSLTMFGGVAFASIPTGGSQSPQMPLTTGQAGSYSSGHFAAGSGLTSAQSVTQALVGFAGVSVQKITVGSAKSTSGPTNAPWVTVNVAGVDPAGLEANWLGALAQGAVADLMRRDEPTTQAVIGGGEVVGLNNSGQPVSTVLGTGYIAGGQQFASPSDGLLRLRIQDVALKFGLAVRTLTILHPLESAISVSFTVPDNAKVSWTIDQLRAAVEGSPRTVEGSLIQLYSTSGEHLLSSGCAYRTGLGVLSFAPGQDVRFGAMHGHLARP